jgi:hypothetical protein
MGRYKAKRRGSSQQARRPSLFFLIALSIGIALLAWAFVWAIRHPAKPVPPAKKTMLVYGVA